MENEQKPGQKELSKLLRVVEVAIDVVGLVMLIIPLILRRRRK